MSTVRRTSCLSGSNVSEARASRAATGPAWQASASQGPRAIPLGSNRDGPISLKKLLVSFLRPMPEPYFGGCGLLCDGVEASVTFRL